MKNLFVILALSVFVFITTSLSARDSSASIFAEAVDTTPAPQNVFVHISARLKVVKRTAQGIEAEIVGIRMGKKQAGKGIVTGQMKLEGGKVAIQLDATDKPITRITMPKGLTLPEALSKKLGASQQIVMSGGSTMLQPQSDALLQFEIQDK
jgi:hypothetical protein